MLSQRAGASVLRASRALALPGQAQHLPKLALASYLSTTPRRPAATEKIPNQGASSILEAQRLRRPVAPHLTAYSLEQTWLGSSIWHRFTGAGLSMAAYAYAAAYLVAPLAGWHLESLSLAAAFGALPMVLKGGVKFLLAWPFVFHCINGVKHLVYDLTYGFSKPQFKSWSWAVWSASLLGGGYLAFLY